MKRLFVWMAALMLLCTSAAAQTCTVDAAGGFTIELPDEWQVEILPLDGQPGTALKAACGDMQLLIEDCGESGYDYSQLEESFLEGMMAESFPILEEEGAIAYDMRVCRIQETPYMRFVLGLTPAMASVFGWQDADAETVDCMLYISTHECRGYCIAVLSAQRLTEETITRMDAMVTSIDFD